MRGQAFFFHWGISGIPAWAPVGGGMGNVCCGDEKPPAATSGYPQALRSDENLHSVNSVTKFSSPKADATSTSLAVRVLRSWGGPKTSACLYNIYPQKITASWL